MKESVCLSVSKILSNSLAHLKDLTSTLYSQFVTSTYKVTLENSDLPTKFLKSYAKFIIGFFSRPTVQKYKSLKCFPSEPPKTNNLVDPTRHDK